jgi:hypothetical protein
LGFFSLGFFFDPDLDRPVVSSIPETTFLFTMTGWPFGLGARAVVGLTLGLPMREVDGLLTREELAVAPGGAAFDFFRGASLSSLERRGGRASSSFPLETRLALGLFDKWSSRSSLERPRSRRFGFTLASLGFFGFTLACVSPGLAGLAGETR